MSTHICHVHVHTNGHTIMIINILKHYLKDVSEYEYLVSLETTKRIG